ncbi:hypothetical protein OUZ56_007889 [Daphnia magna]|uniref:Gamma-tubulin complex component n=2 Tax=Daphnia magna TaxID=35525 RepID=A0ABR0ABA7_9CRUS|nr:hypothetical protein OUZ56_007889 [Daphnia magna]
MDENTIPALVEKLCRSFSNGKSSETSKEYEAKYKLALQLLSSQQLSLHNHETEFSIVQNIKKLLGSKERYQDARKFDELYTRLTSSSILKNRKAVLELMYYLAQTPASAATEPVIRHSFTLPSLVTFTSDTTTIVKTPKNTEVPYCPLASATSQKKTAAQSTLYGHSDVSNHILLREILYAFQGIQGQVFQWDATHENLQLKSTVKLPKALRQMVLSLVELGWLFHKVQKYCESPKTESTCGLAARAFGAALQEELSEYYRLLAVLQSQMEVHTIRSGDTVGVETQGLTFQRLLVWTKEPKARMKLLAALVEACHGQRGGALASVIHSFVLQGNATLKTVVLKILVQVCRPLYEMLMLWTFEGELRDPYGEFFIGVNLAVDPGSLWNDKYYERSAMVPNFFTQEQGHQVATTGKSICFLREICLDKSPIPGMNQIRRTAEERSESLLSLDWESIEEAYSTASQYLLQVLLDRYHIKLHLCALRQYLLLGQGDFVNHLMKLVEPELDKPATTRMSRLLASILDKCIRCTNSQYDDADVLKRLDVRISEPSQGDSGWDVFSLDYKVDGPLGTILTPEVKTRYETLFYALWRSKRMEWIMSKLRHQQLTEGRQLRGLLEVQGVLHQAQLLLSEMIHFAQEMSHYLSFEVVACAWEQLSIALRSSKTMDQLLTAHEHFLQTVTSRALLDEESKDIRDHLRGIHEAMLQFSQIQERLFSSAILEVEKRQGKSKSTIETFLPSIKAKLCAISASYQNFVQTFLFMLSSHSDPNLQGLGVRLDFNECYQRKDSRLSMSLTYFHRRMTTLSVPSLLH